MADARKNLSFEGSAPEIGADVVAYIQQALAGTFAMLGFASKDDVARLDAKVDKVEKGLNEKIDKVDAKIDKVEKNLNEKIDKVDAKIDRVEKSLNEKIDKVEERLNEKIDKVEANLNEKMDKIDARMDKVEVKVDALGVRMWQVGAAIIASFTVIARLFMHT
jgi:DNA anti-recombination protein RmuC